MELLNNFLFNFGNAVKDKLVLSCSYDGLYKSLYIHKCTYIAKYKQFRYMYAKCFD